MHTAPITSRSSAGLADRHATDAYLASELAAGTTANAAFSGFAIRHCAVREGLSGMAGAPQPAAQGGR